MLRETALQVARESCDDMEEKHARKGTQQGPLCSESRQGRGQSVQSREGEEAGVMPEANVSPFADHHRGMEGNQRPDGKLQEGALAAAPPRTPALRAQNKGTFPR